MKTVVETVRTVRPPTVNVKFGHEPLKPLMVPDTVIELVASWVTVKVLPATVRLPERWPDVFAATVYRTSPVPVPVAPFVIVIQDAPLEAVHAQVPADAVTRMSPTPPALGTVCEVGASVNVHGGGGGGAASWTIATDRPAIVNEALRSDVAVFAEAR